MEHKTPSDEIFNEMKSVAKEIWNTYDNTYGYVDEKTERIDSIKNYQDNAMVFYRMFDWKNQTTMKQKLSDQAKDYIENNY